MAKKGDGDGWLSMEMVTKLVARLLATATFWIRIQTSLKNTNGATQAKEMKWAIEAKDTILDIYRSGLFHLCDSTCAIVR